MQIYRVTYEIALLVAANTPSEARRQAHTALQAELPTLSASHAPITAVSLFRPAWESLPAGWTWSDPPYGTDEPLYRWLPDSRPEFTAR
jgi:hypothetical protein